jgi:RimJ/RimL family protein N-acetyltransferase
MPPAVILEGRRVRLEPLSLDHAAPLAQAAAESRESYGFTRVPADLAAMTSYIEAALADRRTGLALPFAVCDRDSQAVVGSTRFLDLDYWSWPPAWPPGRTTPRPDAVPTVAEIGSTWLAASAQRTGCNREAKLLMLGHAFDAWGVLRVTLKTDSRNARSRRAIERIGGRFEGIRRAHARAVDGTVRDTAYYSIVADEWPGVRAALKARISALPGPIRLVAMRLFEREDRRSLRQVRRPPGARRIPRLRAPVPGGVPRCRGPLPARYAPAR